MTPTVPSRRRVLLVEDHADTAALVARVLRLLGHDVRVADGCADAVEAARARAVDVVVCDFGLPDGDGRDLVVTLRRLWPGLKAVALTGHAVLAEAAAAAGPDWAARRGPAFGFDAVLLKPASLDELRSALRQVGVDGTLTIDPPAGTSAAR